MEDRWRRLRLVGLIVLVAPALVSLHWGISNAETDSADLMRRAKEVELWVRGVNPYSDPDATYPPSSLPVFAALLAPKSVVPIKTLWLGIEILSLLALIGAITALWFRERNLASMVSPRTAWLVVPAKLGSAWLW